MKEGRLIVIVAPSGSGKSTLIQKLRKDFKSLRESVSCTTRKPREGEKHGEHYFFISKETFKKQVANNDFIEWAEVHSNLYGTSKQFLDECLERGEDILLDLDVQGTDSIKSVFKEKAQAIFISPPCVEELERRLRGRGTEDQKTIELRVDNAKKEMIRKDDFDYSIINDDLDKAYEDLKEVVYNILD